MDKNLIEQWKKDEEASFKGWDFSYLKDRMIEDQPPWSYPELAKGLLAKSKSLLDIATGGGEILSSLAPLPADSYALEGHKPNVAVAQEKLKSFGVKVIFLEDTGEYPFPDERFDLVLNRHGGLNLSEIHRVLKKGGCFLTQQVDGYNLSDMMDLFSAKPKWPDNTLSVVLRKMKDLSFKIIQSNEWKGTIRFTDVGAIVYFLKAIPWIVDDFSVDSHIEYLNKLQSILDKKGELKFSISRFLISAES
ncbi:MAG: class I SAM-dependent methyltransferase [Patescibacteria group bacterium]|nr:class I SAM-dependent methyltransferase [Patescibacteria group bacterium]